jgi:hypothetical protein
MREVTLHKAFGIDSPIRIESINDPDINGICQTYELFIKQHGEFSKATRIQFQKGPIEKIPSEPMVAAAGVNGLTTESILAVALDRLQQAQKGNLSCRENAIAATKIEEALHWLVTRQIDRQRRGVVGTAQK